MGSYLLRRLVLMVLTLFGMSVLIFIALRLVPGNIADILVDSAGIVDDAQKHKIEHELGLDRSLVVQYGQAEMQRPGIMPYPITLKQPAERVTEENAAVTFTDAQSPLLNSPNKITQDDFSGWVQERASYMPSTFDPHYRTMLAMNDPGEQPNRAAILAASYGKGTYIYVPLALFRQIPAGVPGGARIFANLLGGNIIK